MHISPNDSNDYQYVELKNGLRVLLVSDKTATKSAAALAVNVGHFDDPDDRQGMAHYLEHMLFLGTEKFPKAGEFQQFVAQHGGVNNAWTGTEHTCFFFDITPKYLAQGLERFSQFFIAPLFNQELLEKERQAVESEFQLKYKDDSRRLYQVHKECINQAHPFSKFSVGNEQTLADRPDTNLRDEIVHFHQTQYSADLMSLALLGPQYLDELQQLAEQYFSDIENNQRFPKQVTTAYVENEHLAVDVNVKPLKEIRKLILSFPFEGMDKHYRTKPLSYFAHLIGYEGPNSLMLALKDNGWITSLSAGGGTSGSNFREFTVSLGLTEEGLEYIDDITLAVFSYIRLITEQGFDEWRYLEKQAVMQAAFQFHEPARPIDLVSHLVMNIQSYEPEDIICGDYLMSHYDEALLKEIAAKLVPDNLRRTIISQNVETDKIANWYDAPYKVTSISDELLENLTTQTSELSFSLPLQNPYVVFDLTPKPLQTHKDQPTVLERLPGFTLWHQQDSQFHLPKGMVYIAIDSPHAVANERNIVMTRLCVEMFLDNLATETYQAEIAGIGYNLYTHQGGVTLTLSGFSHRQPELLKVILSRFAQRSFKAERFDAICEQLTRHWQNAAQDRPVSQLFNALTGLLQPNNPPYSVLLKALNTIEVKDLAPFVDAILDELHVDMFVYGDWIESESLKLGDTVKNALRVKDQRYEESLRPLVMLGEQGTFQREVFCKQPDSAVVIYHQSEDTSTKNIALYSLANHLMSATFFHEIRTKQQLGYMVGTGNLPLNRHPGMVLYVQSPNASPSELIQSIDEFLNAFYMVLLELNEYQWHSSKRGLWNQIATPDTTLRGKAQRLWIAIGNRDFDFSHREQVLADLKALSRSDMIRFVVNELKPRTANRLIMHAHGESHLNSKPLSLGQEIGSVKEFQLRPKDCDLG